MRPALFTSAALFTVTLSVADSVDAQDIESPRTVAVTFDDVPATAVAGNPCDRDVLIDLTERLLGHITAHSVPAVGLVTEGRICDALREEVLSELLSMWLDAGLELGNHTFSHLDLNTTDIATYQDDIQRGETITRPLMEARGLTLRYFRYPLLHTGPDREKKDVIASFLRDHGYENAPVTIDNQEWVFASVYMRAKARGDAETMRRVGEAYVPFMERVFGFFEAWSMEVLGYDPPQVLLLHANELNADYFDELAEAISRRGYQFVSLEEALADPAYQLPDNYTGSRGLSWLHRWAVTQGLKIREEPREPDWLAELFRSY